MGLCPVIFLAGLSVLFMMRGDTAHEWHTIWQKEDISITFRENYYASIFLFGIPMGLLILCVHLGVNKLNEQRGNILFSPTVSWVFHGLVFFSIFGLMGLLIFPQMETGTWKDKVHLPYLYYVRRVALLPNIQLRVPCAVCVCGEAATDSSQLFMYSLFCLSDHISPLLCAKMAG